ncbi:Fur family transcriptional regulator [Chryseobacterium sp. NKUCC03_KSP]|uniref:Fur family transcriptional regulator n=1 Tax=Chryseobacterium sp. NKUCC03_KSP TaxID=2842125 RepID=UPI001C5BB87B|nr:transcriptional repressor [Chryseobacterium sp. NKUCC03_KSP]MBW3521341.1 transcriptional repressor [Chryseobacterium sp. NKUCC03_KSP]
MIRRRTPTKEAVLNVLAGSRKAMSSDAVMRKVDISIDRATIYRVLNRFCEDGILHRIVAEDGKQYFAVCIKCDEKKLADHHFHFRCTKCETIECLPNEVQFSLEKGYFVESVNSILTGICKDCA